MLKITEADLQLLLKHNLTELDAVNQFNFVNQKESLIELIKPCDLADGIINLVDYNKNELFDNFYDLLSKSEIKKFVPSSGASSRMFAFLIKSNVILKKIFDSLIDTFDNDKQTTNLTNNLTNNLIIELTDYFEKDFLYFKIFIQNLDKFSFFQLLPDNLKIQYLQKDESFIELEINNLTNKINEINFLILLSDFILYFQIDSKYLQYIYKDNVNQYEIETYSNIKGLGYSNLPKGIVPFHITANSQNTLNTVTAFEEHIIENENLIFDSNLNSKHQIKIEFSINMNYLNNFQTLLNNSSHQNTKVEFSEQYLNTNSLAFDEKHNLVKDSDGNLLLRAGGHGALLYNIQKINEPYIFIRNIDNIPNFTFQSKFNENVKLIIGFTKSIKQQIDEYLSILENDKISASIIGEIENFVNQYLFQDYLEKTLTIDENQKINLLIYLLDRPIRVAAMVKNTGEPGGGPFFTNKITNKITNEFINKSTNKAANNDTLIELDTIKQIYNSLYSKQIVELSQINKEKYSEIINNSKYFNPVFMVVNFTKYDNIKYDLEKFKDNNLGMVVEKDYFSQKIKSYEYPGLWNGTMADWNTIFVDLGDELFFPVKTVNDLIKIGHNNEYL